VPIRGTFNVLNGLYLGERRDFAATERHPGVGGLKYTELLKSHLDGERELADAALAHLGRSVENNKESEEQRVEVRIALVCGVFRCLFLLLVQLSPRKSSGLLGRESRGV
jgi:hypothetical protein